MTPKEKYNDIKVMLNAIITKYNADADINFWMVKSAAEAAITNIDHQIYIIEKKESLNSSNKN